MAFAWGIEHVRSEIQNRRPSACSFNFCSWLACLIPSTLLSVHSLTANGSVHIANRRGDEDISVWFHDGSGKYWECEVFLLTWATGKLYTIHKMKFFPGPNLLSVIQVIPLYPAESFQHQATKQFQVMEMEYTYH